jgi:hypothetical protein
MMFMELSSTNIMTGDSYYWSRLSTEELDWMRRKFAVFAEFLDE